MSEEQNPHPYWMFVFSGPKKGEMVNAGNIEIIKERIDELGVNSNQIQVVEGKPIKISREWHSVDHPKGCHMLMPALGVRVLVAVAWKDSDVQSYVTEGSWNGEWKFDFPLKDGHRVTHWMPLPDLPRKDEK
jgi:hypothetical protein